MNANVHNLNGTYWDGSAPVSDEEMDKIKNSLNLPDLSLMHKGQIDVSNLVWFAFHFTLAAMVINSGFVQMLVGYLSANGSPLKQVNTVYYYGFQASYLFVSIIAGIKFPARGFCLALMCITVAVFGAVVSFRSDMALLFYNQAGSTGNPIMVYFSSISDTPAEMQESYNKFIALGSTIILGLIGWIGGSLNCPWKKKMQLKSLIARSKKQQEANHEVEKMVIETKGDIYRHNGELVRLQNRIHNETNINMKEDEIEFDNKLNAVLSRKGRVKCDGLLGVMGFTKSIKNLATRKDKSQIKK